MNINNFICMPKAINLTKALEGSENDQGTFKEIYEKIRDDIMIPLVDDSGNIIGMSDGSVTGDPIMDGIAKMKFDRRYAGMPLVTWCLEALKLKANNIKVKEIHEEGEEVSVVTATGEVIQISEKYPEEDDYDEYEDEEEECEKCMLEEDEAELPSDVLFDLSSLDIPYMEEENCSMICDAYEKEIKRELKERYGHYIARDADLQYEYEDHDMVAISNITWGRKVYDSDR